MRRRSQADFEKVKVLIEGGLGDSEIARATGIPRGTISGWRHGRGSTYHLRLAAAQPSWRPEAAGKYSYLLGLYLGDGCLYVLPSGSATIVITLDSSYQGIVEEAARRWPRASRIHPYAALSDMRAA